MMFNVSQFIQILPIKRFFVNITAFEITSKQFVFIEIKIPFDIHGLSLSYFFLLDIGVIGACLSRMDLKIEVRP